MASLYLFEARAARDYVCPACKRAIKPGDAHFRHEPFPSDKTRHGAERSHWCSDCIVHTESTRQHNGAVRIKPVNLVFETARARGLRLDTSRVEIVGIGRLLSERLVADPQLIYQLSPTQFQEFICDRFYAMGFEPKQVGDTNRKDGGIDVLFWPRTPTTFPFLGAAQVKHHADPNRREGSPTVRDFAGAIGGHPFAAALLVTNTSFTADAEWFARERANLIRLRDFEDISRWIQDDFSNSEEWREIPTTIELCPGVVVRLREGGDPEAG